jgi:hypothetical protein
MRRLMTWAVAAVVPALLVSTLTIGCSGDNKTSTEPEKPADTGKKPKAGKTKKEELASTGWTTVKGRITLEGDKPDVSALTKELVTAIEANKQDGKFCLEAPEDQKTEQTWRFGPNNGVGNVFVWLAPPDGKYFKIDWDKKPWAKDVGVDQPHCAFTPHAVTFFPGSYEGKDELKMSGQKFIIKNSSTILHNTNWKGGDANPGSNKVIASKTELDVTEDFKPDPSPVLLKCNVHGWMTGVVRVFDHPYSAVTKDDGSYEIKGVPAGADLNIVVWHESGAYGTKGGKDGEKVKLEAGKDNEFNNTIKAK